MHDTYLKRSQPGVSFCTVCEQPAVDAGSVHSYCDKQEVRCRACFKLSRLRYGCRRCTLAVAQHCPSPALGRSIFVKYLNVHLKFTVYGRKQARIHTHFRNAVPLVWGLLRLAPITTSMQIQRGKAWEIWATSGNVI